MMQKILTGLARILTSLKLTILLALLLAGVLAVAAYLEATRGAEWAQWYVERRGWYVGLLGLLAANIVAASLIRRAWRQPAALMLAVGALVLIAGLWQTATQRIDGRLILRKGQTLTSVLQTHRSQLTLLTRRGGDGQSIELGFSPGTVDWSGDRSLDFGKVEGIGVKVLRFHRRARFSSEWVTDDGGFGDPAIQVEVSGVKGGPPRKRWYVPVLFSNPPPIGEPNISIHRTFVSSLLDDFLKPPAVKPDSLGLLSVHYQNQVYSLPVDDNLGKKVPVGDGGLTVEIAEYLANSVTKKGQFESQGTEPKNPMLLLRVYLPDQEQPMTEIAYANNPFITMAAIKKQECPVEFWYHHPAALAPTGAEFLQTPDGKLYCRVGVGGVHQPQGEVKPGAQITVTGNSEITLLKYVPTARKDVAVTPLTLARGEKSEAEAAALVELTTPERREQFWLRRNDAQLGVRSVGISGDPVVVMFGYESAPLGFSVTLEDIQPDTKPGANSGAERVSFVKLSSGSAKSKDSNDEPAKQIANGRPLRHGTFTISQISVRKLRGNVELAELRVTSAPGQGLQLLGGALAGIGLVFLAGRRAFTRRPTSAPSTPQAAESGDSQADVKPIESRAAPH